MTGRPRSNTVTYFSHDSHASHGRTLSILYSNFGHEGISVWWQLLEELSATENHAIHINGNENLDYLASTLRLSPERLREILKKMADLDAIDKELLQQNIIWCDNLAARLEPTYHKRNRSVPDKPNPVTVSGISATEIAIPDSGKPYFCDLSKVKEVKESKVKEVNIVDIPDFIDKDLWNDFLDMRRKARRPATAKAQELLIKDLEKLRATGDDPNEVIKQSIKNSWQGLFALKGDRNGAHQRSPGKLPEKYSDDKWGRKPGDPNYGRIPPEEFGNE